MATAVPAATGTATEAAAAAPDTTAVCVVGSLNVDLVTYVAGFPAVGATVMGERFERHWGGKGANQAVAAASVLPVWEGGGTDVGQQDARVALIGCVGGADDWGSKYLAHLSERGVCTDGSVQVCDHVSTGIASIMVDTRSGANEIVVVPGANAELDSAAVRGVITKPRVTGTAKVLLAQLEVPESATLEAFECARLHSSSGGGGGGGGKCATITIFNPAPAPPPGAASETFRAILQATDILAPNETELEALTGQSVDDNTAIPALAAAAGAGGMALDGPHTIILTIGRRGALVVVRDAHRAQACFADAIDLSSMTAGTALRTAAEDEADYQELYRFAHVPVPDDASLSGGDVVDTVGAGDCFLGAFASYLASGDSLLAAVRKAVHVATLSVRRRGAQESFASARNGLPESLIAVGPS